MSGERGSGVRTRRWEVARARRLREQERHRRRNDPVRRARRRRVVLVVAGVVAVAGLVSGFVIWWPEEPVDLRTGSVRGGSELLDEGTSGGQPLELRRTPESYRIVYRIDDFVAGDHRVSTEVVSVRRPFESHVDTLDGPPPGKERRVTAISAFGLFATLSAGADPLVVAGNPALASGDVRFDDVLDVLVDRELLERRERRRVVGRVCQVYRAGQPVGGGRLDRKATEDEYADECIDDRGLLLEELWVIDGEPVRRKLAVEVDAQPELTDSLFTVEEDPVPFDQGGGQVVPLEPDNRPAATYWALPAPPEGFEHRGRYVVANPRPGQPGGPTIPVLTFFDAYVSGKDVVLIEQGDVGERAAEFEPQPNSRTVELGELGRGQLTPGVLGTVLRARPNDVRFVKVLGTVAPADLVELAAAIQPQSGGEDFAPLEG